MIQLRVMFPSVSGKKKHNVLLVMSPNLNKILGSYRSDRKPLMKMLVATATAKQVCNFPMSPLLKLDSERTSVVLLSACSMRVMDDGRVL